MRGLPRGSVSGDWHQQQQQPGPNRAPRQTTTLSPRAWAPTGAASALLGRGPRAHRRQALQGSRPLAQPQLHCPRRVDSPPLVLREGEGGSFIQAFSSTIKL